MSETRTATANDDNDVTTLAEPTTTEPETKPPSPRSRLVNRVLGMLIPVLLTALGYWSVNGVDAAQSGALGLIDVLPPVYFVIVGLLVVSFAVRVRRRELDPYVLTMHVLALIVLLHGAVSWIEQSPRFPVVYAHMGFTEYIQRNGEALPTLDARMNWPGFFAMSALLDQVAGVDDVYPWLLWAPLAFNLMYAPLIFTIARTTSTDPRVPWIAVWIYYSISWVGQDYFAPQALAFLWFLAFMAIVLRCFRTDRAALPRPFRGIGNRIGAITKRVLRVESLQPGGAPILATTTLQRSVLVATLAMIYAATVVSHQLTPAFLLLEVIILVILRRTVLRGFPMLMTVLWFSFISYAAIGYWSGHIEQMFGSFGKLGGTVEDNVSSKVQVESIHVWVIYGRLLLAAALWATAAYGIFRRLRSGRTDIAAMVGFVAPFFVLGGQSYGGEAILRVFLFSLPFAAILASFALIPTEKVALTVRRTAVFATVGILVLPAFMVARYGNEQFEYISNENYHGVQKYYELIPPQSTTYSLSGNTPLGIMKMEQYDALPLEDEILKVQPDFRLTNAALTTSKMDELNVGGGDMYFWLDQAQIAYLRLTYGLSETWDDEMTAQLLASGRFQLIYENPDARIFKVPAPAAPADAEAEATQ